MVICALINRMFLNSEIICQEQINKLNLFYCLTSFIFYTDIFVEYCIILFTLTPQPPTNRTMYGEYLDGKG